MTETDGYIVAPTDAANEIRMQRNGFFFADRTVKTTIGLSKIAVDLDRFIRLPIIETMDFKDDVLRIAVASFAYDRRFHVLPDCSTDVSSVVLKRWVEELDKVFVALFFLLDGGFSPSTKTYTKSELLE